MFDKEADMGHTDESTKNTPNEVEFINLPHEIYETKLHEIIQNNYNLPNDQYEVFCSAGSAKGDNYIGVVYRVCVRKKYNKSDLMNLIIKLPPQNAARREQFFVRPCFIREADFYDNLYPIYKNFQEKKGIDVEKDGFHQIPHCYKTLTDEPFEGLFFEDLKKSGYEMFSRFEDVTKDHVLLVMKSLAKMHAIFYCIKDQNPKLIESYQHIVDIFLQRKGDEGMSAWFEGVKKQALESMDNSKSEDLKKKVNNLFELSFYDLLETCLLPEKAEPYSVVCHGDCWNNNIMYKYDKNGMPADIRLLDFQIMRYASPVCDLMYYIFCCTTKSLRDQHYQEFMDVYYDTLADFVKKLGSDPEKVFPHNAFNDHLIRFGKFGLIMATIVLPIFTSHAEDIPDMDEMAEKLQESKESGEALDTSTIASFTTSKTANVYAERMNGVFQDMYDLGYL